jgi:serine/threonine-protein kinase
VTRLLRDSSRKVRIEAVHALGALKDPSSVPALCEALRDNDLKVHTAAIDALISINDVSAVPYLIKVLTDESEYARRGAVEVLNEVATQEAIEDLVRALGDEDWWVRVRAADALGTLGGEKVVQAILSLMASTDVFIRRYAVEILYAVPNETAVDELIKALKDEDWWVRERSIDALGKIGDPRAVEPLLEIMSSDPEVQVLCARALGVLCDPRAVGPLCDLFHTENKELNREVREALMSFSKQADITSENRDRIRGLLGNQRVREEHSSIMPLDVRKGKLPMDPELGRSRTRAPLPPRHADSQSGAGRVESPQTAPAASDSKSYPTVQASDLSHQGEKQQVPAALASGADLDPDTVLVDRYRVLRKIGDGGFGTVYLVRDLEVDDELILKILRPQISVDETMIQRFVHELKYTRQIAHKNVIRIYDFLKLGQVYAISMEYFPGTDLSTILEKEGRMAPARSLFIARQICGGLQAAHAEGIIHRDVKPPNIQVGEGDTVKILDFGLASMMQYAGSRLTKSGILIGTPQYMSPEQITGDQIDARSDIYSLGVMLYEMLSGELPVQGDNAVNILFNHLEGEITPLRERVEDIPEELEQLVMRAMARKAEERPESAAALLQLLEAVAV